MSRTINGVGFPTPEPALLQTTLSLAEAAKECGDGLGITKELGLGPDSPANLLDVLRVGGVRNALWCLRCVLPGQEEARDRVARLIAAECAARVLHIYEDRYPGDEQPRRAVEAARDFALGLIDAEALCAAWAARAAAWAASDAACADWAARAAAWAASDAACADWADWAADWAASAADWAASAAASDAEFAAQAEILKAYLKGGEA